MSKAKLFTGIIQHVGVCQNHSQAGSLHRLMLEIGPLADGLRLGDSVAVNGLCLTAAKIEGNRAEFNMVAESVSRSTLGDLRTGQKVNLERALAADGRFDGHIVQGHVDGIATCRRVQKGDDWRIEFIADRALLDELVSKGSIAIDGVSLTLAEVARETFTVALIPTTLADTTLIDLQPGRQVNIELDILGKYVRRYLTQMLAGATSGGSGGLTLDKLRQAGFA